MKLLIIADDFTGAMDTGVQFSAGGVKTLVALDARTGNIPDCEAFAVNLDSRHDYPDDAYAKTIRLLRRFPGIPNIYLKTDSALRGNLSAQFAALLHERGGPVMFVPAYPKAGRATKNGRQLINGVPLEETAFARDPLNPADTGDIRAILSRTHPVPCRIFDLSSPLPQCNASAIELPVSADGSLSGGAEVCLFDCESAAELKQIADMLLRAGALSLTAGCAGFAEELSGRIAFSRESEPPVGLRGPVLYLSGSANRATFEQLSLARGAGISVVTVPPAMKRGYGAEDVAALAARLSGLLARGSAVLATAQSDGDLVELAADSHAAVQALFADVALCCVQGGVRSLAIFGGDTSAAVLRRLGCGTVRPLREIQPGVPLSIAENPESGLRLHLVTKSGGLGGPDVVSAIERAFGG